MKQFMIIVFLLVCLTGCKPEEDYEAVVFKGEYMGSEIPGRTPILFAENGITTRFNERDITFSPEMNEIYFTMIGPSISTIVYTKKIGDAWSPVKTAPFSGRYSDIEASFTPDGSRIYFASKRPFGDATEPKDYDIWYVDRAGNGWGEPVNLGAPINTDKDEFYPSVASNGNLYFTASYESSLGGEDIFMAPFVDGKFGDLVNLGPSVNSEKHDFNAFVSPDESYIIFSSFGRDDDLGGGDLYICRKDENGSWQKAVHFDAPINSKNGLDYCPYISPDGLYFFFTSNRKNQDAFLNTPIASRDIIKLMSSPGNGWNDIYWIDAKVLDN